MPGKSKQARVLIIDDEPVNLKLLDKMLRGDGYSDLVLIGDPRLACEAYQAAPTDLILLDINMPHLDGFQVMAQLRALNDPLLPPIVVLTAQSSQDRLLKALSEGARDFIGKPFDLMELLARVRNLLDAHLAHRLIHEQKSVLEEMVRERTRELRESRLQIVQRLGRAAEYRDNETGAHVLRMSHFSALLARSVGWNETEAEKMLNASPMHDVGKIGISDLILLKPGLLTPEERVIMNTHAEIGADILSGGDSDLLDLASEIAWTHHEKWDGSGYPRKLAGEAIPLAGRIVAIADVFDALSSERPYKKAWSIDDSMAYIRGNAGTHFDPSLVPHFIALLPEILAIRERFAEPKE